jgi:hypothetical protein
MSASLSMQGLIKPSARYFETPDPVKAPQRKLQDLRGDDQHMAPVTNATCSGRATRDEALGL